MDREITITIRGMHCIDGEWQDPVVTKGRGKYILRGGKHYVHYGTEGEDPSRQTHSTICFSEQFMRIHTRAQTESEIVLETGVRTKGRFLTGGAALVLDLETQSVDVKNLESAVEVNAEYTMYTQDAEVQKSHVSILIEPAGKEN